MSLIHLKDAALPAPLFRRLRAAVLALGSERIRSTYQTTFWFDFGRPSSLVEEAVLALETLLPSKSLAGVEWWLSRMYTGRVGVDFHQDRDERLLQQDGMLRHPRFSSVLFLNRVRGGALAVTVQPPDRANPSFVPLPFDADLISPRPNRLVWFDGSLTHGVLDADNAIALGRPRGAGQLRLSVVMNWWSKRPTGVPIFSDAGFYRVLRTRVHRARRP